jgi:hypothetical protein
VPRVGTARRCYIRKPGPRSEEPFTSEECRLLSERVRLSIWRVGEAILHVQRLAQLFGDDPAVIVRCRYTGLRGRRHRKREVERRSGTYPAPDCPLTNVTRSVPVTVNCALEGGLTLSA